MFSLVAFYSSLANGVTNTGVAAVQDQSMTADASNRYQSPGDWNVLATHMLVPNGTAARINAPSLRSLVLPQIYPIKVGTATATLDGPNQYSNKGPRFVNGESFQPEISRAGAGAGDVYGAFWIGPAFTPARGGRAFTLVATSAVTTVKGAWVAGTLVLDQTLPAGRYAVVGLAAQWAGALYARLIFPGVAQFRPGVLGQVAYGDQPWDYDWRMGRGMDMGEFVFNAPPQLEVFSTAAATVTVTAYLDLIKIG